MKFEFKERIIIVIFCFLLPTVVFSQATEDPAKVKLVNKEVSEKVNGRAETVGSRNTGIMVRQNSKGVIFKSHLHSYPEVRVELYNPSRELIYEYTNELKKNVDYNINVDGLPKGQYLLNFEYESILVVCNLQID